MGVSYHYLKQNSQGKEDRKAEKMERNIDRFIEEYLHKMEAPTKAEIETKVWLMIEAPTKAEIEREVWRCGYKLMQEVLSAPERQPRKLQNQLEDLAILTTLGPYRHMFLPYVEEHFRYITKQFNAKSQKRVEWLQLVRQVGQNLSKFVQQDQDDYESLHKYIEQVVFKRKRVPVIESKMILIAFCEELPNNISYKPYFFKILPFVDFAQAKILLHDLINLAARARNLKYWVIGPIEVATSEKPFATAWEYDKQDGKIPGKIAAGQGKISVGWHCEITELQELSQFANFQGLQKFVRQPEIKKAKPEWSPAIEKIIWDFHRDIWVGDTIIARRKSDEILGIGIVTKTAYYNFAEGEERIGTASSDKEEQGGYIKPRFVEVFWVLTGIFSSEKLKLGGDLEEITSTRYKEVLELLKEVLKKAQHQNIHESIEVNTSENHSVVQNEHKHTWIQELQPDNAPKPNYYIGIDLGTTNSVMAWGSINPQTNHLEPKVVPINMLTEHNRTQRRDSLPSCIFFQEGQPPKVGEYAKKMSAIRPDRVVKSIQLQMGTQKENYFKFDGVLYTPIQISAEILRHLAASAKSHFGFIPNNAVLTVPAVFNANMRDVAIKAAELAGFQTTRDDGSPILLDEPASILYDRINQEIRGEIEGKLINSPEPQLVLIFDLGGGTLDVSLYQISFQDNQEAPSIRNIATSRYTQLAGYRFDELLADHFLDLYLKQSLANSFDEYVNVLSDEYVNVLPDGDDFLKDLLKDNFREYTLNFKHGKKKFSLNWNDFLKHLRRSTVWQSNLSDFQIRRLENVFRQYVEQAKSKFPLNLDSSQNHLLENVFWQYAEQAKIDLSKQIEFEKEADIWNPDEPQEIPTIIQKPFLDKEFRYEQFSLGRYEQVISPLLAPHLTLEDINKFDTADIANDNIIYPILDVLQKGKNRIGKFPEVDVVLLNGGMTKLHTIQKRLETLFEDPTLVTQVQDGAVARGAVVYHYYLEQGLKPSQSKLKMKEHPDGKSTERANLNTPLPKNSTQHEIRGSHSLNIDTQMDELRTNLKLLAQTNDLNIRQEILYRIKTQESRIVQDSAADRFIGPICEIVNDLDSYGKMLTIDLLGKLAATCSNTDLLYETHGVIAKLITPQNIETSSLDYITNVASSSVETIGKIQQSITQSSGKIQQSPLFNLLASDKTNTIQRIIIHSIGKYGDGMMDAVEHLKPFTEQGADVATLNQIAANWALGKIGSREKANPLPIQQLTSIIPNLMNQLKAGCNDDIKRNSIYALAEICDQRKYARDIVNTETAAEVILELVDFLTDQVRDSLGDSTPSKFSNKLYESAFLAIQMIQGIDLSIDQEASLRAIREEN